MGRLSEKQIEMNKQREWIKQIDVIYRGEAPVCPSCGKKNVKCKFYAFPEGVGYGDIECLDCGESMHISRMSFPEYAQLEITQIE